MKRFFTLILPAAALLGPLITLASAEHRQVFLLGGQSNMRGLGTNPFMPVAAPLTQPLAEVRLYFGDPNAVSSLPEDTWIDLAPGAGDRFGPELSFGHVLNGRDPTGNYALIKYAQNGSDVHQDWNPNVSNNVYTQFRSTVDAALQALTDDGDTYEIVGMLWTQGIRDAREGRSTSQFQMDLDDLIADVRSNYGSDLPIFISRLSINMTVADNPADGFTIPTCSPRDPQCTSRIPAEFGLSGIRLGQEAVAASDALAFLIDTDAFGSDASHFNTLGQIALGDALAVTYFQNFVIPEPSSLTISWMLVAWRTGRQRRHKK